MGHMTSAMGIAPGRHGAADAGDWNTFLLFETFPTPSKSPFDSVLTQQYLCPKLAKSVDVQCIEVIVCNVSVVFWDTVYNAVTYKLESAYSLWFKLYIESEEVGHRLSQTWQKW